MRSAKSDSAVRLYRLDEAGGVETLCYGPLADALALAARQPEAVRAELFVQFRDDVAAYLDLAG